MGLKGDLNVIDWHGLDFEPPRVEHDLPAGGARLMQGARGYCCTVVAGRVTWRAGHPTGALPGKLMRGMRAAPITGSMPRGRCPVRVNRVSRRIAFRSPRGALARVQRSW